MSDSELSSVLSSPPSSDGELPELLQPKKPPVKKAKKRKVTNDNDSDSPVETSPRKKRPASPPHEFVLADNPDIAFIVMFRSRFTDAFPSKLPHYGPQDIENGVVDSMPSPQIESLLCALLALVLNRKKPIERGHHGRALEEAIQTQKHQWPRAWSSVNPLSGGRGFNSMTPNERLILLKTLMLWSLNTSEAVSAIIKQSYKQSRHDDDLNQPLSVQPWGRDSDKRRYWLIEGRDDTSFRLYRENNPALKTSVWISVGGSIEELRGQAMKLAEEGTQASRRLSDRILAAIPRFEATEEKRRRREYRLARKAQFSRPEPGFSLYEGRTRGRRMKYTYSDEEDFLSDGTSTRRSARQSGRETPADGQRATVTASGRQVRPRAGGMYGESLLSGQAPLDYESPTTGDYLRSENSEEPRLSHSRSTRAAARYAAEDGSEEEVDAQSSADEWNSADNEDPMEVDDNISDENLSDDDKEITDAGSKLTYVVKLKVNQKGEPDSSTVEVGAQSTINGASVPTNTSSFEENISEIRAGAEAAAPLEKESPRVEDRQGRILKPDDIKPENITHGPRDSPEAPVVKMHTLAPSVQEPAKSPAIASVYGNGHPQPRTVDREPSEQLKTQPNGVYHPETPFIHQPQKHFAPPAST